MIHDYLEELYDKQALMEIKGELISLPQLKTILKKKSDSSIAHLINSGKLKSITLAGKSYVTKPDLYLYFCPVLDENKTENNDYKLDPHYRHFFGLDEEDKLIAKTKTPVKNGKRLLTDEEEQQNNEKISTIRIRMKN